MSVDQIVPWFSSAEWQTVFQNIYGPKADTETKKSACNSLACWKLRVPALPPVLEATLSLLDVELKSTEDKYTSTNSQFLRLAYSSALMRFVNHVFEDYRSELLTGSYFRIAQKLNFPQWLVDLRHDVAHNLSLPPLEYLKEGLNFALIWLRDTYWVPHSKDTIDYTSVDTPQTEVNATKATYLCMLLTYLHKYEDVTVVSAISIPEVRDFVATETLVLFNESLEKLAEQRNVEELPLKTLLQMVYDLLSFLVQSKNIRSVVVKTVMSPDSLLLSSKICRLYGLSFEDDQRFFRQEYIELWEEFLSFLYIKKFLPDLLEGLIVITQEGNYDEEICEISANWVKEILIAYAKVRDFKHFVKMKRLDKNKCYEVSALKVSFLNRNPGHKGGLHLNIEEEEVSYPKVLEKMELVESCAMSYNPYTEIYIRELFYFVKAKVPEEVILKLYNLCRLVASKNIGREPVISGQIYTLQGVMERKLDSESKSCLDSDRMEVASTNSEHSDLNASSKDLGCWQLCTDDVDWSATPLGILPWQKDDFKAIFSKSNV